MKRNMTAERREPVKMDTPRRKAELIGIANDWVQGFASVPGRLGRAEKAKVTERAQAIREQTEMLADDHTAVRTLCG